jgi:hypothetical protein
MTVRGMQPSFGLIKIFILNEPSMLSRLPAEPRKGFTNVQAVPSSS